MVIVTSFSLLALLLTYLDSKGSLRGGMKVGFLLVTFLGMIHYNYGNDYMAYYDIYKSVISMPFNWSNLLSGYVFKEPGWALLNYIFKPIGGFFMMVAVLNIIQNVIYYKFIKNNVRKSWWTIAIFIYLFSSSFYLMNFSMMRQGLAIAIFLGMWKYIKTKKWFMALVGILLASSVHSSALVLVPFAFWGYFNVKKGALWAVGFIVLFLGLWKSQDFLNDILKTVLIFEEFKDYSTYLKDAESIQYGIGFLVNLIPFGVSLYYLISDKSQCKSDRLLVTIATVGYMFLPFGDVIPLIGRIAMYFNVFSIGAFAVSYSAISNKLIRSGLTFIYVFIRLYDYWNFFHVGVFAKHYSEFHTIFSAL